MIMNYRNAKKLHKHIMNLRDDETGKVYVKFYWWPLIISLGLSILLSVILNFIF